MVQMLEFDRISVSRTHPQGLYNK